MNWVPGGIAEGFALKSGLFDTVPLRQYLTKNINKTSVWTTDRELIIGAVNLDTSKVRTMNHLCASYTILHDIKFEVFNQRYDDIVSATMASSAIPGLFPTINMNNQHYVDGGANYFSLYFCCRSNRPDF